MTELILAREGPTVRIRLPPAESPLRTPVGPGQSQELRRGETDPTLAGPKCHTQAARPDRQDSKCHADSRSVIFIALDNWTINVLNLYTGGLSIANIFERLGRFWTTLIASVVGIVLSAIPDVLNSYLTYATLLGNFFSPIAGVLVFDYLILKRTRLDVPALFTLDGRYRYWGGFNLVAVVWTVLGFLFYMFAVPATWIPTVVTIAFTGIGYTLTAMAVAGRSKIMALGGAPSDALPVPAE
jgi:hypothetical protein